MRIFNWTFPALILLLTLAACGNGSEVLNDRIDSLQARCDSIASEKALADSEVKKLNLFLDEINSSLDSITEFEDTYIYTDDPELKPKNQVQITERLKDLSDLIERQRERINALSDSIGTNSPSELIRLKGIVAMLNSQLDGKNAEIAALQKELRTSKRSIRLLSARVNQLDEKIAIAADENKRLSSQILNESADAYTAYWTFGSSKDLKERGILSGGGFLKKSKVDYSALNTAAFTAVDTRSFTGAVIPGKKVKILSPIPDGSYSLEKIDNGQWQLSIINAEAFWKVSKYLIIQN